MLEVRVRLCSRRKSKMGVVGLRTEKYSMVGFLAARSENSRVEAQPEPVRCFPTETGFESALLSWITKERPRFENMRGSIRTESYSRASK